MNQIYFTADLHFGHSNILRHSPNRPFSDTVDIVAHDEWLIDLWKSTDIELNKVEPTLPPKSMACIT